MKFYPSFVIVQSTILQHITLDGRIFIFVFFFGQHKRFRANLNGYNIVARSSIKAAGSSLLILSIKSM